MNAQTVALLVCGLLASAIIGGFIASLLERPYGDGKSTHIADFVTHEMRQDWLANRDRLLAFWKSGEPTEPRPELNLRPGLSNFILG
jgi:hypothetical protein